MKYYPPRYLFRRFEILRRVSGGERFLEIGPGSLYLAQELLRYFDEGTLVEFNPSATALFDQLDESLRSRLDLVVADYLALENHGKYDCVVACEVMEHVDNDREFLTKLRHDLYDGGQLILSVPARMDFWSVHDVTAGHYRRYEQRDLRNLLTRTGFVDIEVISYGFPFTNFFRYLRIALAAVQKRKQAQLSREVRTQESGQVAARGWLGFAAGVVVNPVTFYPLCLAASMFNQRDWSEAYLVVAQGTHEP
jgi:SAM-dependent methyltransferase